MSQIGLGLLVLMLAVPLMAAPVKLAHKFNTGEKFDQNITIDMKGSAGPEGQKMPLEMTMRMAIGSEVLDVKPNGTFSMKMSFKEMKMSGAGMSGEIDLGEMMQTKDKSFTILFGKKGNVLKTEGMEDLSPGGMPGGMNQTPGQFDLPFFPDHPVDVGNRWEYKGHPEMPGTGTKAEQVKEYVLKALKELNGSKIAVVGVKEKTTIENATQTISSPMGGNIEITQNIKSLTVDQDGEMLFDVDKGRVLGMRALMKTVADVSISTGVQGQNFPGSMKTDMDMNVNFVYDYADTETPDLSGLYSKDTGAAGGAVNAGVNEGGVNAGVNASENR